MLAIISPLLIIWAIIGFVAICYIVSGLSNAIAYEDVNKWKLLLVGVICGPGAFLAIVILIVIMLASYCIEKISWEWFRK